MTHSPLTNQIRLSPQHSPRNGAKIDTFLIHHQAGTSDDAVIAAMISRSRQVSANYTISNEGRITCVVDEDLRAWTSGSSTDGGKGAAWDRRSITVEIENEAAGGDWPISQAALQAAANLLNDLRSRYGIKNVLGHRDLWLQFRASYATFCPGPSRVAEIVALAQGGTVPVPPPPAPTPPPAPAPRYNYTGGAPASTWKGIQKWLAREWGYTGLIDGDPFRLTWTSLQKYLKQKWGYTGDIDGDPGTLSWSATQRWLKALYGYSGVIDGIPGPLTRAALAKAGKALGGSTPTELPRTVIDGVPGRITWTRGQTFLVGWGYQGPLDGIPGPNTWKAMQRFLKTHWGYGGVIDGIPGRLTYTSMQRWLKAQWGYQGLLDGIPGKLTWSAFQRFVNSL